MTTEMLISTAVSSVFSIIVAYLTSKITLKKEKDLIHFEVINNRKISIVNNLYANLNEIKCGIGLLSLQLELRQIREETYRKMNPSCKEWDWYLQSGLGILDKEEKNAIEKLSNANAIFEKEYSANKITFSLELCNLIEGIITMSYFLSMNYSSVALKNFDGSFMVNKKVTDSWYLAMSQTPGKLEELEREFRAVLNGK